MAIKVVNNIIKDYINNKKTLKRMAHNMFYYRNQLKNDATPKQAFAFAIQTYISIYDTPLSEYDAITNTLWQALESVNHSLTRLW